MFYALDFEPRSEHFNVIGFINLLFLLLLELPLLNAAVIVNCVRILIIIVTLVT